jgi:very-short-patch-repair endonuclease
MPRKTRLSSSPQIIHAARSLRKESTPAELVLWETLRSSRLDGIKFRRQHPVGPYILDFYCVAHPLAVEIDGCVHDTDDQQRYDQERTAYLQTLGIQVIRIKNEQVEHDLPSVLDTIRNAIQNTSQN